MSTFTQRVTPIAILRLHEVGAPSKSIIELRMSPEESKDFFWKEFIHQRKQSSNLGLGPVKYDWHEWVNDTAPEASIRIPAKQFDFHARTPEQRAGSASKPLPKMELPFRRDEDKFNIPLNCSISGLFLGKFVPSNGLAVATPYVTAWKQSAFLHPIFSMQLGELLHRAEACWNLEKSGTRTFPTQHKQLLFLAMLHASGLIRQDFPALPNPKLVEVHFMDVVEMLGWKKDIGTDRLQLPRLHVWRGADKEQAGNYFSQIPMWLDACKQVRAEYENVVRSRQTEAKARAKELALKSIRSAMYKDVSLKRLWNWIEAQVPQMILENNQDLEQLFFVEEKDIHVWQQEDVQALEDLVIKHCELGSSVSFEVNRRIKQLAEWRKIYFDTFEIEIKDQFPETKGMPAPQPSQFPSRAAYLVANAKWTLGNKDSSKKESEDDL